MSTTPYMPATWHVHHQLGRPGAHLNPGSESSGPFAVVDFDDGASYFSIGDPAEADRLAAAFTEAARLLREAGATIAGDENGDDEIQPLHQWRPAPGDGAS